jgi:hypothetical protein
MRSSKKWMRMGLKARSLSQQLKERSRKITALLWEVSPRRALALAMKTKWPRNKTAQCLEKKSSSLTKRSKKANNITRSIWTKTLAGSEGCPRTWNCNWRDQILVLSKSKSTLLRCFKSLTIISNRIIIFTRPEGMMNHCFCRGILTIKSWLMIQICSN